MGEIIADVQSLGMGVQSTAMALMSGMDIIPRADFYNYAELRETPETIEYVDYILPILKSLGVNVTVIKPSDIYEDMMSWSNDERVSMIPLWFMNDEGKPQPLKRQCTSDYKIEEVAGQIRLDLNLKKLSRHSIRVWQGISIDEISRAKRSKLYPDKKFRVNHYPFIAQYANITYPKFKWESYSRDKIKTNVFIKNGIKVPPKSACFFCPFHDIEYWEYIYLNFPNEYELACLLDERLRDYNYLDSFERGPFYLYKGLKPIRDLDFDKEKTFSNQMLISGCESGFCFV